MVFKDIIGQASVKAHLIDMVQQNRLSHALLFLGKEGSGALPLAINFAQFVVSQPAASEPVADLFGGFTAMEAGPAYKSPEDLAEDPSYLRAAKLLHPDLHFSYPVISKKPGEKPVSADYISDWRDFYLQFPYGNIYDWLQFIGAENKQGNITAEECNDIIHKLSLKSFESAYKVLVLWMPEYLGKEGNKLLKLIEEPPPNTLFILVAESEEQILPTLLSRCQLIKVPLLSNEEVEEALFERAKASKETASQIAGIAEGNYREALQLLQHSEEDWHSYLREWLNATLKGGPIAQVKFTEEAAKLGREKQKQFLQYGLEIFRDALMFNFGERGLVRLSGPDKAFLEKFAPFINQHNYEALVEEFNSNYYNIERNANPKILFLDLLLTANELINRK